MLLIFIGQGECGPDPVMNEANRSEPILCFFDDSLLDLITHPGSRQGEGLLGKDIPVGTLQIPYP